MSADYRTAIGELAGLKVPKCSGKGSLYLRWLYDTKRQLIAERFGKTEAQIEADVREHLRNGARSESRR